MSPEPKSHYVRFWSCSEVPSAFRTLLPADCNQGWVAHLSREIVEGPLLTFFREAISCAHNYVFLNLPDGSALLATCVNESETPS